MLVQTKIIYTDEKQSELIGKDIVDAEIFIFDLSEVSALMPGPKEMESIIFLNGQDINITIDFETLRKAWIETKGYSEDKPFRLSSTVITKKNEG